MAKRRKIFEMQVNMYDTVTVSTTISEKNYNSLLKSLKRQAAVANAFGSKEYACDENVRTEETEKYTRSVYCCTLGTTDIYLTSTVCKPGYCFR